MFKFLKKLLSSLQLPASQSQIVRGFEAREKSLKEDFFDAAAIAGSPRGLRWIRCEWFPEKALLRDKSNGQYSLLVAVNIAFEALEGSDMENVAAVSTIRDASAVFQWNRGRWETCGRALFNMSPADAAPRLGASYELVRLL
ncbi:MAG: hypothetical protein ACK58L_10830 [Planctomycetota bacterium]